MIYQPSIFAAEDVKPVMDTDYRLPELPNLKGVRRLSCDFETKGKNPFKNYPVGMSVSWSDSLVTDVQSVYLPIAHQGSANFDADVVKRWAKDNMSGKIVIFANAKYDIATGKTWGLDFEALGIKPRDVAFAEALLNDSRYAKLDLDSMAKKHLGVGKLEHDWDFSRIHLLSAAQVDPYANRDTRITYLIDHVLEKDIQAQGLGAVLSLENSIIYAVCEIERNGCRMDVEKIHRWNKEIPVLRNKLVDEISNEIGIAVSPNSPNSLRRVFDRLGIESPKVAVTVVDEKTKEETVVYEESYAEELMSKVDHPLIKKIIKARRMDSLHSKFVEPYAENLEGDLLRSQFHQLKTNDYGTISGRFSATGGGNDPDSPYTFNVQQVEKENKDEELGRMFPVRELFLSEEGTDFFSCDAAQIEYRLFAEFSKAKLVLEAYRKDPRTKYHEVIHEVVKKAGANITYKQCKNSNFARLYSAGVKKISLMIGLSEAETRDYLENYYDKLIPEGKKFTQRVNKIAKERGYITTLLGRRARFGSGERKMSSAVNALIQGSAADIFKLKLASVYRERKTLGITKLRQVVHDEQCGDKDPDPVYTKRIQEFFDEQDLNLTVPILWDLSTGKNWKECE